MRANIKTSYQQKSIKKNYRRVLVIGLDSAEPSLVFSRWLNQLPTFAYLMKKGTWGRLISTIPAITVPAWASMLSSKDPGQLGIYGFHNRTNYNYYSLSIANTKVLKEPMINDILSEANKKVILIGVPPSYPPKPINGITVGCFLTPNTDKCFTWPPNLSTKIKSELGSYLVDVPRFRTKNKNDFITNLTHMTDQHFRLIKKLLVYNSWDFFMFVEIGLDRAQHVFWAFQEQNHPKYIPDNPYKKTIFNYYQILDLHLAKILALVDNNTVIWIVSDHGAQTMSGGFCINEWLINEGYLVIKQRPLESTPLENCEIDWSQTKVWGSGGYYGRLFFNMKGREEAGIVHPNNYEKLRDELIAKLEALVDHQGILMKNRAYKPQELYRTCRGIPPDLMLYLGNLKWRAIGSLGHNCLYIFDNDTGPDGANHSQEGLFIYFDPQRIGFGEIPSLSIYDLAPSFLEILGINPPSDMIGKSPFFIKSNN